MTVARARVGVALATVLLAALASVIAAPVASSSTAASTFPCRFNFDFFDGLRAGYITAGDNADCSGRTGSLVLGVRLRRFDPASGAWRTIKSRTRTFHDLRRMRSLELAEPCAAGKFRANFKWTLRDSGGRTVARHSVAAGPLTVGGPKCQVTLQ